MKVAVLKETFPGERRVALVPAAVPALKKAGLEVAARLDKAEDVARRKADYCSAMANF